MRFSMGRAWSDSFALVRARWLDLLLVSLSIHVVAALAMLPGLVEWFELMQPAADPEAAVARIFDIMPQVMGLSLLANLLQLAGYGAMVALLGPERPSLGKALVEGLKATPAMFLAMVFLLVGLYAAMFVSLFMLIALVASAAVSAQSGAPGPLADAMVIILAVAGLGILLGALYVMLRFVTVIPVAVIEGEHNPFTLLGRSWNLTRANGWRLVAFWLMMWIPLALVFLAIMLAFIPSPLDLTAGPPTIETFVPLWIASFPLNVLLVMFLSAVIVAVHRQLAHGALADEN